MNETSETLVAGRADSGSGASVDSSEPNPLLAGSSPAADGTNGNPIVQPGEPPNDSPESEAGKSAQSFFGRLLDRARGNQPPCTCGKPPGVGGQHKATCPRRKDRNAASSHFAAPDLSAETSNASVASVAVPSIAASAPKNHSFYGRAVQSFLRAVSRFKQRSVEKECKPVMTEAQTKDEVEQYALEEKELQEFHDAMIEWARYSNWPEAHPGATVAMLGSNLLLRWKLSDWRRQALLKALLEEKKRQRNAVNEATQNLSALS